MKSRSHPQPASPLIPEFHAWIDRVVAQNGGETRARKPGDRVRFHWPPHPVSYSFHVLTSDWTGHAHFEAYGERFEVDVARTPHGVFGRCDRIWLEARGENDTEMLSNLRSAAEPLFARQFAIAGSLERQGRFEGQIRSLPPLDQIKLLYCDDRDVANESRIEIETRASAGEHFPLLVAILRDTRHPNRRSAHWCVLDLFEDLPSFCDSHADQLAAVGAMKDLIWEAEDDYARAIYKAGVVLGGHLPYDFGAPILLECLQAPSRIGRRSAIHGLFHVVEWVPEMLDRVVSALELQSKDDPDPQLREFAKSMAADIKEGASEHVIEPVFPEEREVRPT